MRLGGVHAHSHPHCVRGKERTLGGDGRRDGIGCTLEGDKEGVALGVDLASTMGRERLAEETAMLRAEVTVLGTVPARKLRRALDVAKKKVTVPRGRPASIPRDGTPRAGLSLGRPNRHKAGWKFVTEHRDQPTGVHGLRKWWCRCLQRAGVAEGVTRGRRMRRAHNTAGQFLLDRTGNLQAV